MKQRDTFKGPGYFQYFIVEKKRNITEYKALIATRIVKEEHRTSLLYTIFRAQLELWIALYSTGENIQILKGLFPTIVESFAVYLQQENSEPINFYGLTDYIQSLWLISIAILLDISDDLLKQLLSLIGHMGEDALFDSLVNLRFPQRVCYDSIIHLKPYLTLYQAINTTGEESSNLISLFIENYYSNVEGVYWVGTEETELFFGYWLFELAAFVKGLSIDDRMFANNIYYPRDLIYQ
ncbi:MAG: DUF1911 domain-containing protein [Caldilineaceae bacterium]